MKIKFLNTLLLAAAISAPSLVSAADYVIDTKGAHAFIRDDGNTFIGAKPVNVMIKALRPASVNTNIGYGLEGMHI